MDSKDLTLEQVATLFDVSKNTIQNWQNRTDDPLPVKLIGQGRGIKSQYDARAVFLWGIREFGTAEAIDLDRERALNLQADTVLKELRAQEMRGELAPIASITMALSQLGAQINAVLETIPGKLKRVRPDLTAEDLLLIQKEIVKTQNAAATVTLDLDAFAEIDTSESGQEGPKGT